MGDLLITGCSHDFYEDYKSGDCLLPQQKTVVEDAFLYYLNSIYLPVYFVGLFETSSLHHQLAPADYVAMSVRP